MLYGRDNLRLMAKKIVYLFGAGSTQAVIKAISPEKGLLTPDIQEEIQGYSPRGIDREIWNELIMKGRDIEHLISVLESQHNFSASEHLGRYYSKAIVELSKEFSTHPPKNNLYSVLIDLHLNVAGLEEELLSFMTLNYEDILERTIEVVFDREIDYIIKTAKPGSNQNNGIRVFKLHGSFNWNNSRPIEIRKITSLRPGKMLWIPPGVEKRKDNYPFNLLWGKAMEELMNCDILRIVGCSLSRNDWGLIPILYTIQKLNKTGKTTEIEVVDYPETAKTIRKTYNYLDVKSIIDLPEFLSFYKKQFRSSDSDKIIGEIQNKYREKDKSNPLKEWLEAKIDYLVSKADPVDITTHRNLVYNFYNKT